MKKLIKPKATIEDYSEELIQALCEFNGCPMNCRVDCSLFGCGDVKADNSEDDDILF